MTLDIVFLGFSVKKLPIPKPIAPYTDIFIWFGVSTSGRKIYLARSSDRVQSSLAPKNKLEIMPEALEKESSESEKYKSRITSRINKFYGFCR